MPARSFGRITSRLGLGQEAVIDKSSETTAISVLAAHDGLKCALVSIDAIAANAAIAKVIRDAGADSLLAFQGQPADAASRDRVLFR